MIIYWNGSLETWCTVSILLNNSAFKPLSKSKTNRTLKSLISMKSIRLCNVWNHSNFQVHYKKRADTLQRPISQISYWQTTSSVVSSYLTIAPIDLKARVAISKSSLVNLFVRNIFDLLMYLWDLWNYSYNVLSQWNYFFRTKMYNKGPYQIEELNLSKISYIKGGTNYNIMMSQARLL